MLDGRRWWNGLGFGTSFAAAVATLAAVLPLTTLTSASSWLAPAVWCTVVVALVGTVLRRVRARGVLVLLGQVLVTGWLLLAIFVGGRFTFGLPLADAWTAANALCLDFGEVVQRYAAPIPTTRGVEFVLATAVVALALLVDYLAVTRRSPAVAGLPLLAAFLTAAANGASSLSPLYFVVAAIGWLFLISRQGRGAVRSWSSTVATPRTPAPGDDAGQEAMAGFGAVGRRVGVAALLLAVALPIAIPHLPTRYLLDGLGHSADSIGRGGRVGFSDTLDLSRSLRSGSENTVLQYRTSSGSPPPLRVAIASGYADGQWTTQPAVAQASQNLRDAALVAPGIPVVDQQFSVEANALDAPHVAAPQPVVSANFGSIGWAADSATDDLYVRDRPDQYAVTFREVGVTPAQLQQGIPNAPKVADAGELQASLAQDPSSAAVVDPLVAQVTEKSATAYDAAVAIQQWLRSGGGFTYSLDLAAPITDASGATVTDPIVNFLATKQGYCVQFAAAMVMMARAKGIPARMAIGFLPGTQDNDVWTVRSADAHAWPELYFPGAGWLRFEPTPSVRTGSPPAYTVPSSTPVAPGATAGRDADSEPGATTAPTTAREVGGADDTSVADTATPSVGDRLSAWFSDGRHLVLLLVILALLATLVLPVTARLVARRRRLRAATPAQLTEAQWDELVSRLDDLGVASPPDGETPRQLHRFYAREAYLDTAADEALGRVVDTLEQARYARPGTELSPMSAQIHEVASAAAAKKPVRRRVRAFFLPRDGVRWWSRLLTRVTSAPGRLLATVRRRQSR